MGGRLNPRTCRRLDIQGFDNVDERELAKVAPWLRLAFGLCSALAAVGTVVPSTELLFVLVGVATAAAVYPVHPFDLIYNLGIRHIRGTSSLPRRGGPARFACGLAAVWLLAEIWCFRTGHVTAAQVLGVTLVMVGTLVSTTDICIPSMIYRLVFGPPHPRKPSI